MKALVALLVLGAVSCWSPPIPQGVVVESVCIRYDCRVILDNGRRLTVRGAVIRGDCVCSQTNGTICVYHLCPHPDYCTAEKPNE